MKLSSCFDLGTTKDVLSLVPVIVPMDLLGSTSSHLPSDFSIALGWISRMRHYVQMNKMITMTKLSRGSASAVSIPGLRLRTHSGRVSGASLKGSVKRSQGSSTFQRGSFPPMYISVTWWYFPDHGSIVLEITNERINFLLKF